MGKGSLRNQPCPCGSGMKYKFCCGTPQKRHAARRKAVEDRVKELVKARIKNDS